MSILLLVIHVTFSNPELFSNESSWGITSGGEVLASGSGYYSYGADDSATIGYCPVPGCTDPGFVEFNPAANEDDGSCLTPACPEGETSLTFDMMDSYGDGGDGVLSLNGIVVINGMSNPSSLVSETACVDLTSCNTVTFSNSEYYSNESSWSVSLGADVLASGSGYYSGGAEDDALLGDCGLGCTDPAAENYDPSAVTDDNSCTYTCYDSSVVLTLFDSANDGGGSVTINEVNYELPAGYGNSQISFNICLDLDQCNAVDYVDTDIYWDESSWNITLDEVVIAEAVYSTGFGSLSGSVGNCVLGCLDQTAANYNPDATVSSGACSYTCVENESTFTLTMYDSWGDGWTGNEVIIASASNTNSFTLTEDPNDASSGSFETVSVCMVEPMYFSIYG